MQYCDEVGDQELEPHRKNCERPYVIFLLCYGALYLFSHHDAVLNLKNLKTKTLTTIPLSSAIRFDQIEWYYISLLFLYLMFLAKHPYDYYETVIFSKQHKIYLMPVKKI